MAHRTCPDRIAVRRDIEPPAITGVRPQIEGSAQVLLPQLSFMRVAVGHGQARAGERKLRIKWASKGTPGQHRGHGSHPQLAAGTAGLHYDNVNRSAQLNSCSTT
jgi:hypothetical protein